jgi:hypothetical protein
MSFDNTVTFGPFRCHQMTTSCFVSRVVVVGGIVVGGAVTGGAVVGGTVVGGTVTGGSVGGGTVVGGAVVGEVVVAASVTGGRVAGGIVVSEDGEVVVAKGALIVGETWTDFGAAATPHPASKSGARVAAAATAGRLRRPFSDRSDALASPARLGPAARIAI